MKVLSFNIEPARQILFRFKLQSLLDGIKPPGAKP